MVVLVIRYYDEWHYEDWCNHWDVEYQIFTSRRRAKTWWYQHRRRYVPYQCPSMRPTYKIVPIESLVVS